jgi:hypothetical protein
VEAYIKKKIQTVLDNNVKYKSILNLIIKEEMKQLILAD